jgi:hypothetical protein
VNRVTDESLQQMLPFRATQARLVYLMQHVANHSTYHRGQIALMMRQLDAEPCTPTSTNFSSTLAASPRPHIRAKGGQAEPLPRVDRKPATLFRNYTSQMEQN